MKYTPKNLVVGLALLLGIFFINLVSAGGPTFCNPIPIEDCTTILTQESCIEAYTGVDPYYNCNWTTSCIPDESCLIPTTTTTTTTTTTLINCNGDFIWDCHSYDNSNEFNCESYFTQYGQFVNCFWDEGYCGPNGDVCLGVFPTCLGSLTMDCTLFSNTTQLTCDHHYEAGMDFYQCLWNISGQQCTVWGSICTPPTTTTTTLSPTGQQCETLSGYVYVAVLIASMGLLIVGAYLLSGGKEYTMQNLVYMGIAIATMLVTGGYIMNICYVI